MQKINRVFNVLVVVLFCAIIGAVVLTKAPDLVMEKITGTSHLKAASQLEGRSYATAPVPGLGKVASGAFQNQFEQYVSDLFPEKDLALLTNAALQRDCIAMANLPFGFPAYPSAFGSERIVIPSANAITYMPSKVTDATFEKEDAFAEAARSFAEEHPEVEFVFYVVGGYESPAVNPVYSLVSDPLTPQALTESLAEDMAGVSNALVASVAYDSLDSYYEEFFRTDHHWNIKGAISAYNEIAQMTGEDLIAVSDYEAIEGPEFSGATARWGLDTLSEPVFDSTLDYSAIEVYKDGELIGPYEHDTYWEATPEAQHYGFYELYYGGRQYDKLVNPSREGTVLVVANSYVEAIAPLFALNNGEVYVTREMHSANKDDSRLQDYLEDMKPDQVVFVGQPGAYLDFLVNHPNYFEE